MTFRRLCPLVLAGALLTLTLPGASARTSTVLFRGTTGQGLQISVVRSTTGSPVKAVSATLRCPNGATRPFVLLRDVRVNRYGDFFGHDATKRASGHFSGKLLRGKISTTSASCLVHTTFSARR